MLDGEIVLFDERGRQDFDALGQRIHPAESRIDMLAEKTPTRFIAFDLLGCDDDHLLELPQRERRARLEALVDAPVDLTPAPRTLRTPAVAAGRRGRDRQAPGGARTGRASASAWSRSSACGRSTRSCKGWRPGKEEGTVGSLILGLYAARRPPAQRRPTRPASRRSRSASCRPSSPPTRPASAPRRRTEPLERPPTSSSGVLLRPELVVEVTFDHTSNSASATARRSLRWREDKDPRDCTMEQLDQ